VAGHLATGELHFYYPEDARKATVIQRKPGAAH
jgi:hypothetical protein